MPFDAPGFACLTGARRPAATSWLQWTALAMGLAASACATSGDEQVATTASASTVADYIYSGCTTAVVIGLSKQIAEEAGCENPDSFAPFTATGGITFTSSAVLPFLVKGARDDLQAVAAGSPVEINSALRTIAQQYLLYQWYLAGRCGITAAATVGHSNHEGGRAVDLENYDARISAMAANGWAHDVPGDPVHFDHTSSPDDRGQDVKAFQTLWNLNHPGDTIAVDGDYGPQTEARLKQSPATGFPQGPSCTAGPALAADVVSVSGPDLAPPATRVHYTIVVKNTGSTAWPASTQLEVPDASSPLFDDSWLSQTVVTALGADVAPGDTATLDFDVTTPAADAKTPVAQALVLDDGGTTFGSIQLALTVVPGMSSPASADGDDHGGDQAGEVSGGCAAGGGGAGWLALVLPALVVRRRRRGRG